jgi:GNAT superfamily N-acetyltransferase
MSIRVRDAEADDALAVSRLLGVLGYPASVPEARAHIGRFERDPASRVQVALEAEVPDAVGLLATHLVPRLDRDLAVCRITELVVDPELRRRGIGVALPAAAESEAHRHGARRIELSSGERREDSHPFYLASGFERVGVGYLRLLGSPDRDTGP